MKFKSLILILAGFISSILVYIFRYPILGLLNSNLPFRQSYQPSLIGVLFVYALPILLGLVISKLLKNSLTIRRPVRLLNTALITAVVFTFPLLLDRNLYSASVFSNLSAIFYLMIFPFLFCLGIIMLEIIKSVNVRNLDFRLGDDLKFAPVEFTKLDIGVMFLLSLFVFLLNLIPSLLSKYPVGADIYYHISMISRANGFSNLFKNPFFYGEANYYISFIYSLLAFLAKSTKLSVLQVYSFSQYLFSAVLVGAFYCLSKKISRNSIVAFLATILVLPFRDLLWPDPSLRIYGYTFFLLFVCFLFDYQTKQWLRNLILAIVFLVLAVASHPEIAVLSMIVFTLWLLIKVVKIPTNIFKITYKLKDSIVSKKEVYLLVVLLTAYLLVFQTQLSFLMGHFPASQYTVFNEVAFSVIQPFGVVSFLVLLFFPFGFIDSLSNIKKNGLLISVSALYLSTIFYFTLIWSIYYRYFAETAYLIFIIFAAQAIYTFIFKNLPSRQKIYCYLGILGFVFLSVVPKYNFIYQYSLQTNLSVESRMNALNLIKSNTSENSVILASPDDMVNRYIPYFTGRYIFAGSSFISKDHQWQVLSFCNGPFAPACLDRSNLAYNFYEYPSNATLLAIKQKYKVDYLLVDSTDPIQRNIIKEDLVHTAPVKSTDGRYWLYKI